MTKQAVRPLLPLFALLAGLALGSDLALAGEPPSAIAWRSWGREPFDQARQQGRLVLLLLADDACEPCRGRELAAAADPALAQALSADLVLVRAERLDRPDLDDLFSMLADAVGTDARASDEEGPGPRYPLLVFLLPDGRPFAVSRFDSPAEARRLLLEQGGLFRNERPQAEERATHLTETLRAGQRPSQPQRPLGPEALEGALKGLAEAVDPSPGVPLLAEEAARTDRADVKQLLDRGLARLAGKPEPDSLAAAALRLTGLARGQEVTGDPSHAEAAKSAAQRMAKLATSEGSFPVSPQDDRVIAGWNGLALSALAASGKILERPSDLKLARAAARTILDQLGGAESLARSARETAPSGSAFLEDYAFLAQGFLDLHEATGERPWLLTAQRLADAAIARFFDAKEGGFFSTDAVHEPLPVRPRTAFDGPLPSGNGVMASVLLRLARLSGETRYVGLAQRTLEAFAGDLERAPRGMETLAAALGDSLGRPAKPAAPASRFPAQATAGPIRLAATAQPATVRPGQAFQVRITLTVAAGWRVVAAEPGLKGLLGLAVSVPGEGLELFPVRFPVAQRAREGVAAAEFNALEGESAILVPVRYPAAVKPGEKRVRVRVRFQPCGAKGCEAPDSVVLDASVTVVR